jgi:uncharacterized protein YndB with AHSA1/START domain
MAKGIHHKLYFAQPAEIVWEYLTKPELIAQWLMENDFQPIIGYDFQFRTRPVPKLNFDGIVYCRVVQIVPFKKLSYSWKTGPGDGKIVIDSIVEWTLHSKGDGTELQLDHTGITDTELNMYSTVNEGWLKNMKKIAELIDRAKHDTTRA